MQTCDLSQKWATAAVMPRLPSIEPVPMKPDSSMAKLQKAFNAVGLPFFTGRAHLFVCTPSEDQAIQLKKQGIDVITQKTFTCSPRLG